MDWRAPVALVLTHLRTSSMVVLFVGIGLSAAAFISLRHAENQRIDADFRRHSTRLAADLQRILVDRLAALRALASLDAASTSVVRDEFRTFAGSILADRHCIKALEWTPRVSDAERAEYERAAREDGLVSFRFTERNAAREIVTASRRPEYYPVYFLEPYEGNEAALGFDLASDPMRKAAIEKARDIGGIIITDRLDLVQDGDHQRGFLALMPVYHYGRPQKTVAERRANLKGFEVAVFRTDEIVDSWRSTVSLDDIAFVLSAGNEAGEETVVYATGGRSQTRSRQHFDFRFDLGGRTWSLHFEPGAAYLDGQQRPLAWTALLAGLVFVVLLGALLISSAVHTERIERCNVEVEQALSGMRLAQKEAELLDRVMQKINVGVGLDQILDYVFESFEPIIPYDRIGWVAVEHDGRSVRSRWARSKSAKLLLKEDYSVPLAVSSLRFVMASGMPRIIQDLEAYLEEHPDSESTRLLLAEGLRSNLTCPLVTMGKTMGFLFFSSTSPNTYRSEHVETFMRIANQLAMTLHKGRLYDEIGDELHKSEERFALAVRGTDAGIWDWDLTSGHVYFSPRWKSMLGYSEDEIADRFDEWERLLHPEDRDRARATVQDYLDGRTSTYELDHRLRHRDGTYRWIVARGAAVYDAHGKPYRMVGSHIDVTARRLAEESLREICAELLGAQKIQAHLLPKAPPEIPGLDIAGACYPSSFTAGDYFDYLMMGDGSLVLVIADVMGHGFGPALLAATLHAHLRSMAGTSIGIGQIADRLNRLLCQTTESGRFVTLFLVRLDPQRMLVQYVSAGHPPGYLFNISGSVKAILDKSSLPLGLEPDTQFLVSDPLLLNPGDVLFLMTDGITEAVSPENEQFGILRALELVRRNRGKCARDMIEAIRDAATAFGDGQEHLDDLTAVVLKVEYVACGLNASREPVQDDARESATAIGSAPCQTASATK